MNVQGQREQPAVTAAVERRFADELLRARALLEKGALQESRQVCLRILLQDPYQAEAHELIATITHYDHSSAAAKRFPGPPYLEWLQWLHGYLRPRTYVEIGVETGQSLAFAQNPTRAIGIDPEIRLVHQQECWTKLFKQPSDAFFARYDLASVLDGQPLDFAFVDGLHTFDQALRDFTNLEQYAHGGTVVAFHDIFPVTPITASRERRSLFWVGDTWKVVMILRETRPDLRIATIPTFPSGLALVYGLDHTRRTSAGEIEAMVARWMPVALDSYLPEIDKHLNVVGNVFSETARWLESRDPNPGT